MKKPSLADYQNLKNEVSSWKTDDKLLVIQCLDNIITIINGIEEGLDDLESTRAASPKAYICNAGVSLISTVSGFLAGALTTTIGVGPLVGAVVSTAVGTYLGANMC